MADAIDANANVIDAIDANANVIDATENDIADDVPAINFNLSNDADHATLNFFSNPMYLSMIKEKLTNTKTDKNKPDVKFYRKRLIALFKDLLKDEQEPPTQELKQMYTRFVGTAINHFEIMDKKDIIQGQYIQGQHIQGQHIQGQHIQGQHIQGQHIQGQHIQGQDPLLDGDDLLDTENITIDKANDLMMKKTIMVASLDNYVIAKHDNASTEFRIIPLKLEINLKTPELKTKGLKAKKFKKTEKSENKEEDLSQ
jgi:hypothetical protein